MIRLRQTFGAHAGRELDFDRDVIRFGRLPDNEVAFDPHADLDASGRHAEIRREGVEWTLIDVGSRNGTLVGGNKVSRHVLRPGDEIEFGLGGPRVRVEFGGAPSAPPGPPGASPSAMTPPLGGVAGASGVAFPAVQPGAVGPPEPAPAPPAADGQKRYGQRTVGMMIQSALAEAGQSDRDPEYLRQLASEAAHSSSRRLRLVIGLLSLLLFLTLAGLVALFFYARWQDTDLREENVRLQGELAELGEGESAERGRLEDRIHALNEQLADQQQAAGARIAQQSSGAIWAVVRNRGSRGREVLCSAFAVRADLLATSAGCVGQVETAVGRGQTVQVIAHRGSSPPVEVSQMWRHPLYSPSAPASPDVGLIRVSGVAPSHVTLGEMNEIAALAAGDDVFVLGFPEALAADAAPVAGITSGVVGRITAFDGSEAPPPGRHLVAHSALTHGGTAGSPVFDQEGRVVAINGGNFRGNQRVVDRNTGVARTVSADTPYAWAVRADLLLQLLAGLPSQ